MKILITRPRLFAEPLCQKIRDWGGRPWLFPALEIVPTPKQRALMKAVQKLDEYDLAIFSSRPAAMYGAEMIQKVWLSKSGSAGTLGRKHLTKKLVWAAIGPGTAKTLSASLSLDISSILQPLSPPFESESLLALPEFQNLHNKKIILFRGNGGRSLLPEKLTEGGAELTLVEAYQRQMPVFNPAQNKDGDKQTNSIGMDCPIIPPSFDHLPDVVVVTSIDALKNLNILLGDALWHVVCSIPFVVVGSRLEHLARTLGIQQTLVASGAEDGAILKALIKFRERLEYSRS